MATKLGPRFRRKIVQVWEYERGLLYVKGRFERIIEPGRYVLWPWQFRHIDKVDMRETSQTVQGQEVLTSDKVGVRVTLIAQYCIKDPITALHNVESYANQFYQDLQLTLREQITGCTVEELLQDREALSGQLEQKVAPRAAAYGLNVQRVGVKDIVLPGVVRHVFLQEVQADRAGRAKLISARHETAAARAQANTARLLNDNPHMMRLRELDTLASLASKSGNVLIIPGLQTLLEAKTKAD